MAIFKYGPVKAIFALLSCLVLLPMAMGAVDRTTQENIQRQDEYMTYLENEFYANYTPCDEQQFASFDIAQAIDDGVKFNEVAFLGTHNSYQLPASEEYKKLAEALDVATFSIASSQKADFKMDTLTEQFELGIRSIELDIETIVENGEVSFVVSHDPKIDNTSNCYDFEKALTEIKMWSDANPDHLPITVIIEPKKLAAPVGTMKKFTLPYANACDELLRDVLGDTLLTPADMMGDYESFGDMRANDGWLSLGDTMGKVLVLLHDTTVTGDYIKQDSSIRTQAMFPMLRYADRNESYASFIIDNTPSDAIRHNAESIDNCNLIVRTRADSYPSYSESRYEQTLACGSQIISTDYPVNTENRNDHVFTFDGGYTVQLVG